MALNFAELVPVELVDAVGLAIGAFVALVVFLELVRWRSALSPIAKARQLGWNRWLRILAGTIKSDLIYQQIDLGFEKGRWLSHSLVMWGFVLLSVSTTLNYVLNPSGYPLSLWHVVRITGNLGGVFFIAGLAVISLEIASSDVRRDSTRAADYLFAILLILAGLTGFTSEFASELNARNIIYVVYVVHLLSCAALLATAPFTKFVHAIGRPLLRLSENYLTAMAQSKQPPALSPIPRSEG